MSFGCICMRCTGILLKGGAQLLLRCVERLLRLKLYELPEAVFGQIRRELCSDDIGALERVISSAGL